MFRNGYPLEEELKPLLSAHLCRRFLLPISFCTTTAISAMSSGNISGPVNLMAMGPGRPISADWTDVLLDRTQLTGSSGGDGGAITMRDALTLMIPSVPLSPAGGATPLMSSLWGPLSTPCPLSLIPTAACASAATSGQRSPSQPSWLLGPWGPCSSTCGGSGTRKRAVMCVFGAQQSTHGSASSAQVVVGAGNCSALYGPVPPSSLSKTCNSQPCAPLAWEVNICRDVERHR